MIVQLIRVRDAFQKQDTPPPAERVEFPEIVQLVSVAEALYPQYTPLPPSSAIFSEIVQLVSIGKALQQYTPPPTMRFDQETLLVPSPPVSLKLSSFDSVPSPLSNITTLALSGFVGVSDILIVVTSAPPSDLTTMFFTGGLAGLSGSWSRLKSIGSVITYSPGMTSTVSPSAAASMAD
ncbi:MAG TPA: hypothetical protein DCM87_08075 [Planctomycetes bacterium]|nr:hypothetical protein [Planctomycetota bacterium]